MTHTKETLPADITRDMLIGLSGFAHVVGLPFDLLARNDADAKPEQRLRPHARSAPLPLASRAPKTAYPGRSYHRKRIAKNRRRNKIAAASRRANR